MLMSIAVDPVGQSPLQALGNNSIILLNSNIIHYHSLGLSLQHQETMIISYHKHL